MTGSVSNAPETLPVQIQVSIGVVIYQKVKKLTEEMLQDPETSTRIPQRKPLVIFPDGVSLNELWGVELNDFLEESVEVIPKETVTPEDCKGTRSVRVLRV